MIIVLAAAAIIVVVLVVPFHHEAPPLHHTTNLTTVEPMLKCLKQGACAKAYELCLQDVECSAVVAGDTLNRALRQRRKLPLLPRNDAMRDLTACADRYCLERRCWGRQAKVAFSGFLTNDVVKTETADECEARCKAHVPPIYGQSCAGYTWIEKPRLDDKAAKHTCFLIAESTRRRFERGAVSGRCGGGPSGAVHSATECRKVREDPKFLAAYLKVTRHVTLSDIHGLFDYMEVVDMCPHDVDFDDALAVFKGEHHPSKSLFGRLLAMIVDVVEALFDVAQRINPSFLLALLLPLIPKLRAAFPRLFSIFGPLIDALTAHLPDHHKKKKDKDDDHKEDPPKKHE